MKRLLIALIVGAFVATPAMADLFNFTYSPTLTSFDTTLSQFVATVDDGATGGIVARLVSPGGTALFDTTWLPENMYLQMQVSNISLAGDTADGSGFITLTDKDDDQINADFTGKWISSPGKALAFDGVLSQVFFSPLGGGDNTAFNGDSGSAPMTFTGFGSFPFFGTILELTTNDPLLRFTAPWTDVPSGAVSGTVVPVPAALLLGALGLGAAGVKLRRFV